MIRLVTHATVLVASFASAAAAGDVKFPYEATISTDNVYLRSGPGRKYYHTNKLNRGERVVVHRHDPGGWYMVEPPKDAFSWIRAEYVKTTGQNQGHVTQNDVVVWVGSEFGLDHDVTQRKLSTNEQVQILGEQTFQTPERTVRMYKIAPPRYEYRWLDGKYVVPKDAMARRRRDLDPYTIPTSAHSPKAADTYDGLDGKHHHDDFDDADDKFDHDRTPSKDDGKAVNHRGPSDDRAAADRARLEQLDKKFREIIGRDTKHWNFTRLEDAYRDLQDSVSRPALRKQVALRLDAVERYQKIKAEYDEFIELTSATNRRDRWLVAAQYRGPHGPWNRRHAYLPPPPQPQPRQASTPSPAGPQFDDSDITTVPSIAVPSPTTGSNPPPTPDNISFNPNEEPQSADTGSSDSVAFDGAGVVQRVPGNAPGTPRHMLVAPGGQMLAYLQPDSGVNLDAYVGRSMGVYGKRWHRPDLRTDFIVVRELEPVKLTP